MQHKTGQDELLTRYLLGDLAPDEQLAVEERLFSDNQFFEELMALESTLADQYAKGKLTADQRTRFEAVLRRSAEARGEVNFARHLIRDLTEMPVHKTAGRGEREAHDKERRAFAAAGLSAFLGRNSLAIFACLLLLAVGLLAWNLTLRYRLNRLESGGGSEALREELASERQRRQELERELAAINQRPPENPAVTILALSYSNATVNRGGDNPPTSVYIARTASQLRIEFGLDNSPLYDHYSASVETVEGRKVWDISSIPSDQIQDGRLVLNIPAGRFENNDYLLKLVGREQDHTPHDLGEYPFRVRR